MKSMPGQDKVSILLTFVIGLVAGGYVYLTGFATTFVPPEATTEDKYDGLVISGESYGECEIDNSCLSFQLLGNGTYRAIYTNPESNKKISKDGSVNRSLRNELKAAMQPANLIIQSKDLEVPNCAYGENGTNFKFKITLNTADYNLDTCKTDIDYSGQIWLTLVKVWNYFAMLSV